MLHPSTFRRSATSHQTVLARERKSLIIALSLGDSYDSVITGIINRYGTVVVDASFALVPSAREILSTIHHTLDLSTTLYAV